MTHEALLPKPALFDLTSVAAKPSAARSSASSSSTSSSRPTSGATSTPSRSTRSPRCWPAPASSSRASATAPTPASRRSCSAPASAACSPPAPATASPAPPGSRACTRSAASSCCCSTTPPARRRSAGSRPRRTRASRSRCATSRSSSATAGRPAPGLPDPARMAVVCADLGISAGKGHSLRRQLALPDAIRERVAERPTGDRLSVRMAHRLADMHDVAPELAAAVAARVTTSDLHDQALRDLGGFVHRTVVENDDVYAVRIDDGVLLDAAEQIERARRHLTAAQPPHAAARARCTPDKLDTELDTLAARARSHALKLRVDGTLRDRAANGRYAWTFDRGQDFAAGIWLVDPVFMLDTARQQLADADTHRRARRELLRRRPPRRRGPARRRRGRPPAPRRRARPPRRSHRQQPRPRPRHPRRPGRPHRRPAPRAARDRLPPALPPATPT